MLSHWGGGNRGQDRPSTKHLRHCLLGFLDRCVIHVKFIDVVNTNVAESGKVRLIRANLHLNYLRSIWV